MFEIPAALVLGWLTDRAAGDLGSWPLGAVRMTEEFLPGDEPATKKQLKALRAHVRDTLA